MALYASLAKGKNHQNLIENPRSSLLFIMVGLLVGHSKVLMGSALFRV